MMIHSAFDCYFGNARNKSLCSDKHRELLEKWTKKFYHSSKTGGTLVTIPLDSQTAGELREIQQYLFYLGYKLVWDEENEKVEIYFI